MTQPKHFTVENLIADWETINTAVSPNLLTEEVNPALAQLSILSSRREYWHCFVCAIGFAREHSITINDLLGQTAADLEKETVQAQTREFLDYCASFTSIPEETLSAAAGVIVSGIGTVDTKMLMDYETCYAMCGDDNACLRACLRKPKRQL